jgi:Uma2 family endonuclease
MTKPIQSLPRMSLDEFFVFVESREGKYELIDGLVVAMSGASANHGLIAMNIAARFWNTAQGGPCRVFRGERLLARRTSAFDPDVMVVCGDDARVARCEERPVILVEVLSPNTERRDRQAKLMAYRDIPTLRLCLIVSQEEKLVERHWRDATGAWQCDTLIGSGCIPIPAIECSLTLDDVYQGITMPTAEQRLRLREEEATYR